MNRMTKTKAQMYGGGYILNKKRNAVFEPDIVKWAEWFEKNLANHRIAYTTGKKFFVSTVFLGLNYNWSRTGKPTLWESMVFKTKKSRKKFGVKYVSFHESVEECRYSSKSSALKGHKEMVKKYLK